MSDDGILNGEGPGGASSRKAITMSAKQRIDRSRRSVIKSGLAGFVAVGASGLRIAEAQTPARSNGPLFFDVETASAQDRRRLLAQ